MPPTQQWADHPCSRPLYSGDLLYDWVGQRTGSVKIFTHARYAPPPLGAASLPFASRSEEAG